MLSAADFPTVLGIPMSTHEARRRKPIPSARAPQPGRGPSGPQPATPEGVMGPQTAMGPQMDMGPQPHGAPDYGAPDLRWPGGPRPNTLVLRGDRPFTRHLAAVWDPRHDDLGLPRCPVDHLGAPCLVCYELQATSMALDWATRWDAV